MIVAVHRQDGTTRLFREVYSIRIRSDRARVAGVPLDGSGETLVDFPHFAGVSIVDPADLWKLIVRAWVLQERALHAGVKYGDETNNRAKLIADATRHPHLDGEWWTFITNYLTRA